MKNERYEMNDNVMENVSGGQNTADQNGSGFKCPYCGGFINITIYEIIEGKDIVCSHCNAIIPVDKVGGNSAIDALRKVKEAQEKLNNK